MRSGEGEVFAHEQAGLLVEVERFFVSGPGLSVEYPGGAVIDCAGSLNGELGESLLEGEFLMKERFTECAFEFGSIFGSEGGTGRGGPG